jgi:hypothetical protein
VNTLERIERILFLKRSEHIRLKENYFRSEANTLATKKIIFEAKRTLDKKKIIFESKGTLDRKKIIFEAKRTPSILKGHGNEPVFPLHSYSSRSDFDFEFVEIFLFEKRLPVSLIGGVDI